MTHVFRWPHGETGAVSLSFDDGMDSQLDAAIPQLERFGVFGTFYIHAPGDARWQRREADWIGAHTRGHEIGNHSMSHPCCLNMNGPRGLASWTLEQIEADVLQAQRTLDQLLPDPRPRSFAYPCYESDVGHGLNRCSYVPVIARHFPAARAFGFSKQRPNHPLYCDLHRLSSHPMEDADSQKLIGAADMAIADGGWVILTFHGIDEGHLPTGLVHLHRLLCWLQREKSRVWTAPVVEVGQYLAQQRAMAAS